MDIYEPHGNYKPKPYQNYKMKRKESNQNTKEIKRKEIKGRKTAKDDKNNQKKQLTKCQ